MNEQDTPENIVHGYVAQDVSESAAKEGAEVTLTSLFKKEEMTAAEQEVNDAMHEGVNILNGVMPVKIEKNDDNRAVAMIVADCTFDDKNIPGVKSLKDALKSWLDHRQIILQRKSKYLSLIHI